MVKERHSRDKETFWIYFLITQHEPKLGPIRETETLPFGSGSARISQVGIIRILKTYFHRTRIPNCLWSRANTQQDFAKVIRTHELGEKKGTKKENHNIISDPWAKIRFIIAGLLKWSLFCFKVFFNKSNLLNLYFISSILIEVGQPTDSNIIINPYVRSTYHWNNLN